MKKGSNAWGYFSWACVIVCAFGIVLVAGRLIELGAILISLSIITWVSVGMVYIVAYSHRLNVKLLGLNNKKKLSLHENVLLDYRSRILTSFFFTTKETLKPKYPRVYMHDDKSIDVVLKLRNVDQLYEVTFSPLNVALECLTHSEPSEIITYNYEDYKKHSDIYSAIKKTIKELSVI